MWKFLTEAPSEHRLALIEAKWMLDLEYRDGYGEASIMVFRMH